MKPKKKPKKPIRTEFISVGEMKPGFWVFHPKGRSLLSYHHCECGCSGRLGTHYWYPDYEDKRAEKHFLTLDHEPHGTHVLVYIWIMSSYLFVFMSRGAIISLCELLVRTMVGA
jgi:hypothetical protein